MLTLDDLLRIADCAFALHPQNCHAVDAQGWEIALRVAHTDVLQRKMLVRVPDSPPRFGVCYVLIEHGRVYVESTVFPGVISEYTVVDLNTIESLTPFDPEEG